MRILFIHNRYQYIGGEDVAVEMEMAALKSNGHVVEKLIFDNTSISGLVGKLKTGIRAIYNSQSEKTVLELISSFRPDVIHVHNLFFVASPSVLFAAARSRIPVIMTLHNYRMICANALLLRNNQICEKCVHKVFPLDGIRYKCYRESAAESALVTAVTATHKLKKTWRTKVSRFIALTEFAKDKFIHSSLSPDPGQFVVKPNFVPDPGNTTGDREDFFLFVGRLSVEKGISVLLNAFKAMPETKIIIAGDGPLADELKTEFASFQNISFVGSKSKTQVLDLMKRCKALIFPSIWYEGLPYTILEAFSTSTPVIATKTGAMQSMITDGFNGFHFAIGDSDDLLEKVRLFDSDKLTGEVYSNARQTYLNHYHPESHYKAIIEIYDSAINELRATQV